MATVEVVQTDDGSCTVRDVESGLLYGSKSGAVTEARHIYVEGTGVFDTEPPWRILEFGFGAGVNLRETLKYCQSSDREGRLVYHSVESNPAALDNLDFQTGRMQRLLERLYEHGSAVENKDGGTNEIVLHECRWQQLEDLNVSFDAIYYDPFGPGATPDCWTKESLEIAYQYIDDAGILGTFSSAVDVRECMADIGFDVVRADGPGHKRHITFASKSVERLRERFGGADD